MLRDIVEIVYVLVISISVFSIILLALYHVITPVGEAIDRFFDWFTKPPKRM